MKQNNDSKWQKQYKFYTFPNLQTHIIPKAELTTLQDLLESLQINTTIRAEQIRLVINNIHRYYPPETKIIDMDLKEKDQMIILVRRKFDNDKDKNEYEEKQKKLIGESDKKIKQFYNRPNVSKFMKELQKSNAKSQIYYELAKVYDRQQCIAAIQLVGDNRTKVIELLKSCKVRQKLIKQKMKQQQQFLDQFLAQKDMKQLKELLKKRNTRTLYFEIMRKLCDKYPTFSEIQERHSRRIQLQLLGRELKNNQSSDDEEYKQKIEDKIDKTQVYDKQQKNRLIPAKNVKSDNSKQVDQRNKNELKNKQQKTGQKKATVKEIIKVEEQIDIERQSRKVQTQIQKCVRLKLEEAQLRSQPIFMANSQIERIKNEQKIIGFSEAQIELALQMSGYNESYAKIILNKKEKLPLFQISFMKKQSRINLIYQFFSHPKFKQIKNKLKGQPAKAEQYIRYVIQKNKNDNKKLMNLIQKYKETAITILTGVEPAPKNKQIKEKYQINYQPQLSIEEQKQIESIIEKKCDKKLVQAIKKLNIDQEFAKSMVRAAQNDVEQIVDYLFLGGVNSSYDDCEFDPKLQQIYIYSKMNKQKNLLQQLREQNQLLLWLGGMKQKRPFFYKILLRNHNFLQTLISNHVEKISKKII